MGNKKAGAQILTAETIIKSDYFLMILTAAPLLMRTK